MVFPFQLNVILPAQPPGVLSSGMAINSGNHSKIKKILDYGE
jgi:hypothetical protein